MMKLFFFTLSVMFGVYLMVTLPIANAAAISSAISYETHVEQKENNLSSFFSSISIYFSRFLSAISDAINSFVENVLPGVKAQTCGIDANSDGNFCDPVSYTHLTLPTTPYV